MYFAEIPSTSAGNTFERVTLEKIYEAQVRSIKFTRPNIYIIENRIAITVGTLHTGGVLVLYCLSKQPTNNSQSTFVSLNLENENLGTEIPWINGIYDFSLNQLIVTYVLPQVNSAAGITEWRVFLTSLKFGLDIKRDVLLGMEMHQSPTLFPNILSYSNSSYQMGYLTGQNVNQTQLVIIDIPGPALSSYSPPPFPTTSSSAPRVSTIRTRIPFPNIPIIIPIIAIPRQWRRKHLNLQ